MLVMGLFAACGSDAAGASSEATAPDHDVADAADAVDIADGSAPGRLRATILMGGASPSWQPEALADTDEGWVLLVDLGAEPLTATRDGVVSTLEPGLAEVHRLALLPVAVDGTIGAPIEVARTAGVFPLRGVAVRRCGDHLWGTAERWDQSESWVFRARTDLSDLTAARFVAVGNGPTGDPGVADSYGVQCAGAEAVFVVRHTAGLRVTPPGGDEVEVAAAGETWRLVDGVALFEAGRFEHIGARDVVIDEVRPGRRGTFLYAEYDVNGPEQVAAWRILRHDFATGLTTRFIEADLPDNVSNPVYAEDLEAADGGSPSAMLCARFQGAFELDDVVIDDPLASDFCASVVDGRVVAARAFRNIVPTDVTLARGQFWFAGSLAGADPTLGDAANDGYMAFLVGLDPTSLEVVARATWAVDRRDSFVRSIHQVSGRAPCPEAGVAMEVQSLDPVLGNLVPELELVMAAPGGTACADAIASVTGHDDGYVSPTFSAIRQSSCAMARRLAILPAGYGLSVGTETSAAAGAGFSLVIFEPEECSMTSP